MAHVQEMGFLWKGQELTTMGDVLDALRDLHDADEAVFFLRLYRLNSAWADENVAYATQRCLDPEDARRVTELLA